MRQLKVLMLVLLLASITVAAKAQDQTLHTVKRGETLSTIAQMYGITEKELRAANPNMKDLFFVGMKLQIPSGTISSIPKSNDLEERNAAAQPSRMMNILLTEKPKNDNPPRNDIFRIVGYSYFLDLDDVPNKAKHYWGASGNITRFWENNLGVGGTFSTLLNINGGNTTFLYNLGPNFGVNLSPDDRCVLLLPITLAASASKKINWGCGILPSLSVDLGGIALTVGFDIYIINGNANCGLRLALGGSWRN